MKGLFNNPLTFEQDKRCIQRVEEWIKSFPSKQLAKVKTGNYRQFTKILLQGMPCDSLSMKVGRKVGIFDTFEECKVQVLNFPKAKYKKFDRIEDAEAFIKQFSGKASGCSLVSSVSHSSTTSMTQFRAENTNPPELVKVEKISPKSELFAITNRVSSLEEKLSKFMTETSCALENLVKRVNNIENKLSCSTNNDCSEPPVKKMKIDSEPSVGNLLSNSNGFVVVYTDGACTNNGKMGAQAGIGIWFNDNHPLNISAPVQGPATNNNAEIQAARVAITQAHHAGVRKLSIHTDSKFVINCITDWINKWKKNNWQLSTGGPVKNKDELVKLDDAIQLLEAVEWNYVAGHRGIRGNEMADKLAREGASFYKKNITYSRNADTSNVKFFGETSEE